MKNRIFIIFLLLILFSICCVFNISSATKTGTVYIESDSEIIEKDEEVEITINLKDAKTAAFNFSLYFDETKFDIVSFPENTNVIGNQILFVWFDATGGKNPIDGELVSFKFKSKQNGLGTFVINGEFYSEEGQLIQTEFKEKQVQIGKEKSLLQQEAENEQRTKTANLELANTNLEILAIENYLLNPPFDVNETNYKTEISNGTESINVLAVPENEQAKAKVVGNTNLKIGNNLVTVTVTASNGFSKRKYFIEVHRRNDEEEKVYLEEEKAQIERAKELYKLKETSNNYSKDEESVKKDNNKNVGFVVIIIILVVIAVAILCKLCYNKFTS